MEENLIGLIDGAIAIFLAKGIWYLGTALVAGVGAVIGTLLWGRGGRKRLVEDNKSLKSRVDALEAEPSESTQVILQPGATYNDFRGASGEWHLKADGQVEVISARRIPVQTLVITLPAMEGTATVNKRTPRADKSDGR